MKRESLKSRVHPQFYEEMVFDTRSPQEVPRNMGCFESLRTVAREVDEDAFGDSCSNQLKKKCHVVSRALLRDMSLNSKCFSYW